MVRITGQRRPDRGTIGRSGAHRDYRMSTECRASMDGALPWPAMQNKTPAKIAGVLECKFSLFAYEN
jgi:hypothetical protein